MIQGSNIRLRLVQQEDLAEMYRQHTDVPNRGDFYPIGVVSFAALRNASQESGFWDDKKGLLLIVDESDAILGHIEYFETVPYLDEFELSYILYSKEHRGRGFATEAVDLLTAYLFDRKKLNRVRLVIHADNAASKRVAAKAGYSFEGVARGAWFHRGRNHDVEIWSILRTESEERRRTKGHTVEQSNP